MKGSSQNSNRAQKNNSCQFLSFVSSDGVESKQSGGPVRSEVGSQEVFLQPFCSKNYQNQPIEVTVGGGRHELQARQQEKIYRSSSQNHHSLKIKNRSKDLKQYVQVKDVKPKGTKRSLEWEKDNCFKKDQFSVTQDEQTHNYRKRVKQFLSIEDYEHHRAQKKKSYQDEDIKVKKIQLYYCKQLKIQPPKVQKQRKKTQFFKQLDKNTSKLLPIKRYINQNCSLEDEETINKIVCFVWEILNSGCFGFIFLNIIKQSSIEEIVSRIRQIAQSLVPFLWKRRPPEVRDLIQKGRARQKIDENYDACIKVRQVKEVDYLLKCGNTYHKMLNYKMQTNHLSREIRIQTLQLQEWIYLLRADTLKEDKQIKNNNETDDFIKKLRNNVDDMIFGEPGDFSYQSSDETDHNSEPRTEEEIDPFNLYWIQDPIENLLEHQIENQKMQSVIFNSKQVPESNKEDELEMEEQEVVEDKQTATVLESIAIASTKSHSTDLSHHHYPHLLPKSANLNELREQKAIRSCSIENAGCRLMVCLDKENDKKWFEGMFKKIMRREVPVPKGGSGKYLQKHMDFSKIEVVVNEERRQMEQLKVKQLMGGKKDLCMEGVETKEKREGGQQSLGLANSRVEYWFEYQKQLYKIWEIKQRRCFQMRRLEIVVSRRKL